MSAPSGPYGLVLYRSFGGIKGFQGFQEIEGLLNPSGPLPGWALGPGEFQTRIMELGADEDEKREALDNLVVMFLRGLYENFDLSFGYLPELYEDEFKRLVEGYVSSATTVNGDVFIDEYIYDIGPFLCDVDEESGVEKCEVMRKHLIIRYHKDVNEFGMPIYVIIGASGKTEYIMEEKAA